MMKITGLSHLFKWENLHNWWLTKYFFAPLYIYIIIFFFPPGCWLPSYKLETYWAMGLHVCMMYNALASAIVLLQNGAAVNNKPNGKTPLHVACTVSNAYCVGLLLEWGTRINSMSLSGHTHYCITRESLDCAKHLILKGL